MSSRRFRVVSLGCRTNQYEGEAFKTQLKNLGFLEATGEEKADLCIVNSCTVTASADERSIQQIRALHEQQPHSQLIVTGCLAERARADLEKIEGVTAVISNLDKEHLVKMLYPEEEVFEFSIDSFSGHTRAFVKVQDGCNSFCSYCIIPYVRGRSRSRTIEEVVREGKALVAAGYQEIVLTGINIGDFDGGDGKSRLKDLVKAVDEIEGLSRLRLSSIDPDEVDDDLLGIYLSAKKSCPSMHVVLQSGSNAILKKMRRKYTRQDFFHTIRRLKEARADFTFTTDVIYGFPGESEMDFQETLDVVKEVQFAKVHLFPYSPRPGTWAARLGGRLGSREMHQRKKELASLANEVAFTLRSSYVGKRVEVLVEAENRGYTANFLPVRILGEGIDKNRLVSVTCVENNDEGLIGVLDQS